MSHQSPGINRLFWTMTIVLCAGLLGIGCIETLLLKPLRQSIVKGVIVREVTLQVASQPEKK